MLKVVWGARFREGLPREQASAYWTDVHAPLGLRADGLRGYVQNHVVVGLAGADDLAGEVFLDGYSCEWWDNEDAFERTMASPEWRAVVEDGPNVFDMGSLDGHSAVVQQRTIKDGPLAPFKVVWFARFLPELDRVQAGEHWLNVHAQLAVQAPGIDRYVQNLVGAAITDQGVTDDSVAFDGFSECWFADRKAFERALASPAWGRLEEDAHTLFDMTALHGGMSAVLDERVIREEPAHR